ncbi:MAG: polyprenyl synthetase family protein [Syntrophales bacterium]|jgi:octaprenyl-diphosphate synthase|nr:polyprenyl synthetase family protein [Syntrophales bacterium]MCK9527109.1 polyprenyl synthetase family protein [Syntrophales bacterium]MDX9921766.1 polyprenyl synthetase family protein [Syntrophales bacterium]
MQLRDITTAYEHEMAIVESLLEKEQNSYVKLIPEISRHIIMSGGKRIRPLLLMITADLFGYRGEGRYPLATVIEFIHTASLLHDDVIDHASMRRGKASANRVWGNAASVLVGDYLYATAHRLLTEINNQTVQQLVAWATTAMVEGETIQLMRSGDVNITEEEYLSITEKKTAVLMAVACALGAVLAEAPESSVDIMKRFGMKLGVTFQMTDDTLDYVGIEEEFGKTIGMDIMEGKMTLPLIWSLKQCPAGEGDRIRAIIAGKTVGDKEVFEVARFINAYGGIDYARERAGRFVEEAKQLLTPFPDSFPKKALLSMSDHVLQRNL